LDLKIIGARAANWPPALLCPTKISIINGGVFVLELAGRIVAQQETNKIFGQPVGNAENLARVGAEKWN
jgi:hypothetical protein